MYPKSSSHFWYGSCFIIEQISTGGDAMNIMIREFAQVNFFVIWFVVVTGFAFIKLVKNRLQ
jgi:hypothetical protein